MVLWRVAVGGGSQTGRAMTVPLRSRPGTMTDPVGVLEPTGVAAEEVSAEVEVSGSGDGDPRI